MGTENPASTAIQCGSLPGGRQRPFGLRADARQKKTARLAPRGPKRTRIARTLELVAQANAVVGTDQVIRADVRVRVEHVVLIEQRRLLVRQVVDDNWTLEIAHCR